MKSRHGRAFAALALVFLIYACVRWTNESPAFDRPREISDTRAYVRISGEGAFTRDVWAAARPPIYPLVLKIFSADPWRVSTFQTLFSILAWFTLAVSTAAALRGVLRAAAFTLVLALSLDRHVAVWDVVVLTESVSLSLMVLFVSAWIWSLRHFSAASMVVLGLIGFLWSFTRDTNAWLVLLLAVLLLLAVILYGAAREYLWLATLFGALLLASNLTADMGARWVFPFQNVLAQRILTDEEAVDSFAECGMPVTPALLQLAGGNASSEDRAFYSDPALEGYRAWLHADGKMCYIRWLAAAPWRSLSRPVDDFAALVEFESVDRFFPREYRPLLPSAVERLLHPRDALPALWALMSALAVVAIIRKSWRLNPLWIVFIGLCLLIYPHFFLVWHGDTLGTPRHALGLTIQFALAFWLAVFLLLESALPRARLIDLLQRRADAPRTK